MPHRVRNLDAALIARYGELLHYDPETGLLTWRVNRHAAKAGTRAGSMSVQGYLIVRIRELGQSIPVHRLGWALTYGRWPREFLDHINGKRSDNRLCNLLEADQSINSQNQRRAQCNNATGLIGAHWHKASGRFTSSIYLNGKSKHLGLFKTAEEAHAAYVAAKRQYHPGAML